MSQLPEQKTKKRKYDSSTGQPTPKRPKTHRKEVVAGEEQVRKDKPGKEGKVKHKKDKGKAREDSQFKVIQASLALSIAPIFASNLRVGAEEMLDSMVMKYIPALQGVVLAHDNVKFLGSAATVKADCPFANCTINFDATVWSPHVGMKLVGKVNLSSPDHVSLLVHRTFNVSIPRQHIPSDNWEFEYGPAENDPEFGATAEGEEGGAEGTEGAVEESGRWVHKLTGTKIGGNEGYLEFTVVGMTIANQMLSLIGSIQPDPFSPEHVPSHSIAAVTSTPARRVSDPEPMLGEDVQMENEVSDEDDTFQALGRMGDEAAAREKEMREKELATSVKESKRKRKEDGESTEKKKKKKEKKS